MPEIDLQHSKIFADHSGRTDQEGEQGARADKVQMLQAAVRSKLRTVLAFTGVVFVLSIVAVLLTPNEYESEAKIMPLDQQTFASHSYLNSIAGIAAVSGLGRASLLSGSQQNATETLKAVAASDTVRDVIIRQFNLQQVYRTSNNIKTRKALAKHTTIESDKASGIVYLSVRDRDRARAQKMVAAYIDELNKMIYTLSSSSARRERIFLEQRLKDVRNDMDTASGQLSTFSSQNLTLDPQAQALQAYASATKIKADIVAAQTELAELRTIYTDDNPQIHTLRARIVELQSQMQKESSAGVGNGEEANPSQPYPSIRQLPYLGLKYGALYQQLLMQKTLYETLTKQYELAKIEEAKEIPSLSILDEPEMPEIKSSPHRIMIVAVATLLAFFLSLLVVALRSYSTITNFRHPFLNLFLFLFDIARGEERNVIS